MCVDQAPSWGEEMSLAREVFDDRCFHGSCSRGLGVLIPSWTRNNTQHSATLQYEYFKSYIA